LPRQVFLFDQVQRRSNASGLLPTTAGFFNETQFSVTAAGSGFMSFLMYKYVDDRAIR
jgi:hypothetical protein